MPKALVLGGLTAAILTAVAVALPGADKPAAKPAPKADEAAVGRTRDTVKMLDNIYKNAVVLITETYVNKEDDVSAGTAAVELFKRVAKDGSHQVRLIDVTGQPYDEKNVAADDFDRAGVDRLKAGESYYDQVVEIDGKPQLRAMTAIPVVMEKCVMCHAHYKSVKKGAAVGALTYTLPIK
ncbi:MAG: DUF3365 domain-containing protein [Planctomycetaceae bacterium]